MAQGLQVWDENGNCIVDIGTRTTFVLGSGVINQMTGSITDERLRGREWWVAYSNAQTPSVTGVAFAACAIYPSFALDGATLSWEMPSANGVNPVLTNIVFFYGVF